MLLQGWAPATQIPEITNFWISRRRTLKLLILRRKTMFLFSWTIKGSFVCLNRLWSCICFLNIMNWIWRRSLPLSLCSFRAVSGRFGLWSVYGIRSDSLSYVGEEYRCFHEAHLNFGADLGTSTFFCGMLTGTFSDSIYMVMIFRSLTRCVICSSWTINGCLIFHWFWERYRLFRYDTESG